MSEIEVYAIGALAGLGLFCLLALACVLAWEYWQR